MKIDPPHRTFAFSLLFLIALTLSSQLSAEGKKGSSISRSGGGEMNLFIENQNFELHFYDEEGEAVAPDAAQAVLHYTSRTVKSRETLVLLPEENEEKTILTSQRQIRRPYNYDILLVLNFDDQEREPESHHLIFIQNE